MDFQTAVIEAVCQIPPGQTRTYAEVARAAGYPRAYRAIGNALHRIWQTDRGQTIPCHRVVRSDGRVGGYAGGINEKRQRLAREKKVNSAYGEN